MGSMTTLLVTFASTVGGILVRLLLRRILPQQHLRDDSKDVLKLGAGVIATLSALVLGLLVGSAKSSFDSVNSLIVQMGAKIITLDRALAHLVCALSMSGAVYLVVEMTQPFDGVIRASSAPLLKALQHINR